MAHTTVYSEINLTECIHDEDYELVFVFVTNDDEEMSQELTKAHNVSFAKDPADHYF